MKAFWQTWLHITWGVVGLIGVGVVFSVPYRIGYEMGYAAGYTASRRAEQSRKVLRPE